MKLIKWKPQRAVARPALRPADLVSGVFDSEFDWLLDRLWGDVGLRTGGYLPAVDLSESDSGYELRAELPGVNEKDLAVEVQEGVLTIRGERGEEKEEAGRKYRLMETLRGSFERSFRLPSDIDAEKISANYRDGILTVSIPRTESEKPRRISVKH